MNIHALEHGPGEGDGGVWDMRVRAPKTAHMLFFLKKHLPFSAEHFLLDRRRVGTGGAMVGLIE